MTDASPADLSPVAISEDRTFAAVVYGLYFLGLAYGLTMLVGLVLAYAKLGGAGPKMRTHYLFQIRTVWIALAWSIIGGLLILVGLPLSLILIGIPIVKLGVAVLGLIYVWILARCVAGALYLFQDAPYPRPRGWLI